MQKGGSQYGVPPLEMPPFAGSSGARPPPAEPSPRQQPNFEDMALTVTGGFGEDELLGAGEEVERGVSGNRWPRQETLALLKIRSDMDATFREASLKGPLWEEVSRKLAEQGYTRSAKKCKEKFENVHKYYKRTKDSRAARPDGKSYRFFSQLEALQNPSSSVAAAAGTAATPSTAAAPVTTLAGTAITMTMQGAARIQQPTPISSIPPGPPPAAVATAVEATAAPAVAVPGFSALGGSGVSFSSNSEESGSETEDEDTEEGAQREHRKRKREEGGRGSKKLMAFFEGLMKQVIERQEAMQHKFLETIEKREQDRMIREEAWRRQEMARLSREHEAVAQERAVAASRDATIISFLQKITGQSVQLPPTVTPPPAPPSQPATVAPISLPTPPPPPSQGTPTPTPPPPQPQPQPQPMTQPPSQPPPQQHPQLQQTAPHRQQPQPEIPPQAKSAVVEITATAAATTEEIHHVPEQEVHFASGSDPTSSRWPKTEVHALINIRAGMEARYQEAGPKGPLWEEISAAMKELGYIRNAKRCKEKWENINKYFKKVKESNKKRPEDAKTCPYFHQLDALYRKKVLGSGSDAAASATARVQHQEPPDPSVLPITTLPPPSNGGDRATGNPVVSPKGPAQVPTSNGGLPPVSFSHDTTSTPTDLMKKPEDIMKELMEHRHQRYDYDRMDEDEDTDDDEDEDDDMMDEEEQKMAYKIEFQRPTMPSTSSSTNTNGSKAPSRNANSTGSFLAMVHQ